MKQAYLWVLGIIFVLLFCLVVALLLWRLFQTSPAALPVPVPTPEPAFTATATQAVSIEVTPIPSATPTATVTPTSEIIPPASPTPSPTVINTPVPLIPQVAAAAVVNIRSGPGTNYPAIGLLSPGISLPVTGQNEAGTWWQVRQEDGLPGWVAATVVEASDVVDIPVTQAPPPAVAVPTETPVPAAPAQPAYQFEPTGWYGDTNAGLTRFLGTITDSAGNPVNGVTVEAQCGTYRIISNPSGPVPAFNSSDSANDPPGFYDITIDRKPVPCQWLLTVVHSEDGQTVLNKLSDTFEVEVTMNKSIIVANWRKNW